MSRPYNFASGPATLPEAVLRKAQAAIWDLDGSGIGILEHSHRGREFGRVLARAEQLVREVAGIGDAHAVLFVTAGATHHFTMVPQNFLGADETADYCHTGVWSGKAMAEAKRYGHVHVACSAAPAFDHTPSTIACSASPRYVHYTSNETIYGTQWSAPPDVRAPLVCDASSDIFSRPWPYADHALVYAGAQKNLGPSGISLVIARRDWLATETARDLPALARYSTYAQEQSMHNTPNTFGVFVIAEVCAWIQEQGGLAALGARNAEKAALLYDYLDQSTAWRAHARAGSRSQMNVTFRGATTALEEALLARAEERGLLGLRGHRSVGGMRASIYNAMPRAGVVALVELLDEVARAHAHA